MCFSHIVHFLATLKLVQIKEIDKPSINKAEKRGDITKHLLFFLYSIFKARCECLDGSKLAFRAFAIADTGDRLGVIGGFEDRRTGHHGIGSGF